MSGLRFRLGWALAAVVSAPVRVLPRTWAAGLGRALGWVWYRLVPVRRGVARANVRAALAIHPEPVVQGMYRHLGLSFIELLRGAQGALDVRGREHLPDSGAVILTAHLGNWELLARAGTLGPRPLAIVTKRFRSRVAEGMWRGLRRGGPELLTDGDARAALRALAGGYVGYVLDQHVPPGRAVWVPFFGRPAATSPDLARLARLAEVPIVPVFTWRDGQTHVIDIQPPVPQDGDDLTVTRRCAAVVEAAIRARPAQWLWIHRRWKAPPQDVADALARSPAGVGRRRALPPTVVSPGRASPDR